MATVMLWAFPHLKTRLLPSSIKFPGHRHLTMLYMYAELIDGVGVLVVVFHHALHLGCVEENAFAKFLGLFAIANGAEI